jgi:hemoglobin/transferrin/lactoferrin receptor protein
MMNAQTVIATLLIGLTASETIHAATSDDILEEVIVVAKRRTPLQHVAATVTVIDQQQITRTLSDDVRDLVRYEPGVTVRNDPVRFGLDSFAIRGVGGDRVAVEVDGVGVAESFTVGALADSGRVFTDLDFIQRVEILHGPASALYGSDAIGGVVRFQTIDPSDVLDDGRAFTSRMRAGYRGDTEGWSATSLNAWSASAAEMLLGYVHREQREADIASGLEPNPRDSRSDQMLAKVVLPNLSFGPVEIALDAGRTRDETIVNALLGLPPRFVNTIAMSGDDTAERLRLSIEQTLAPRNAWMDEAVWRLHAQRTDTEQLTDERRRAAPPRSPPTELQRVFALEDEMAGAELTASRAFQTGSWSHQLVYGVELDVGRVAEQRDGYERNLTTGRVSPVILGEVFPLRDFPITKRIEAGVYVQDELRIADGRWRLTPGVRFDVYRLRAQEDQMYREDNPSARPVDLDEQALAPKLALSYEITDGASAFAQYARGFRSPPFEDVNIGLEIPLFNYRALPNPELRPETSDSFEIGLRTRDAMWRATLSAYYTEFEDFIESRVNLGPDPASGMTLFQSRNIERARMYGVELASQLDVGELAAHMQGWSVGVSAAWARGDNTATDQPLNSIEPLQGSLTIDYDAPASWGARLAATAAASKDRLAEGATPLYRTEGYLVLDAFAYFELGDRGLINVGVTNLTDERYIEWIDVRGRAASDPLVPYATHPGRSGSVNVSWSF